MQILSIMSTYTVSSDFEDTLSERTSLDMEDSQNSYDVVVQFHSAEVN
jgi:hypothetical protein